MVTGQRRIESMKEEQESVVGGSERVGDRRGGNMS